jgi:hypothetical protein
VIHECPHCHRVTEMRGLPRDLPGAVRVIVPCPSCPDDITLPVYLTETGEPVTLPR